jgi:predicted dehydrogenase
MGRIRARAAAAHGARVIEVSDVEADRARELAAALPGCVVRDDPKALSWDTLDAVFVCTPPFARGPVELTAIERGVPFLVEKPVGLSANGVAAVSEALARRPVLSAVGYMNRYRESVERARELLRGETVLGLTCHWIGTPYRVAWWPKSQLSGGAINEQTTHLVDLGRYLVGEFVEVQGIATPIDGDGRTTAAFNLRFRDGALYSLFYSCGGETKMITLQAFTPTSSVALDGWEFHLRPPHATGSGSSDRDAVFHAEVAAFLVAVERETAETIRCSFEDGIRTQRVVDALFRSLASGKVEPVDP